MDQSNDSQRAHAYHPPPYPVVPQNMPTAGPVGSPLTHASRSHPQLQTQNFTQQSQRHHSHYDNMSFPNLQCSATNLFPYNTALPAMVPPHFPIHPVPNPEAAQYYHTQPFPHHLFQAAGFVPSFPQGFSSFVPPSQPPPYNHHLPSPVQSVATSVASTGFSNSKDPLSPTTTVASTKKMTRKSPVIASTPLKTSPYDDDCVDIMSPTSTAFGDDDGPTNVYIKGLPPTLTDRELKDMVSTFGVIISSKAIIDRPSGVCKGYGFAKFTTPEGASACIEDLKSKGLEATVARDSFYSKLKDLADLDSTNLYVSNLPTTWNEAKITAVFTGYKASKCRLLVNPNGKSRGVAFVTFEDRTVCDEIIEKFNGLHLGEKDHHLSLQVRYADTLAQKKLKKEQQAVGQFPKKSVLINHQQTLQKGLLDSMAKLNLSDQTPLRQRAWRSNGAPPVNAPPTPPRSVISAEDDLKSD